MDPHITVLGPDRPRLSPEQAAAAFTAAPIASGAFRVRFAHIGTFRRRHSSTLILLPDSKSYFHQLFESTRNAATWQDTITSLKRPYEPHITLANQVHEAAAPRIREQLLELNLEPEFTLDCVSLYAKQAHWPRWQLLAERPL